MSTSTIHGAAGSGLADQATGMVRLSAAQATRRAVLHVQAAGDPPVPADVANWFTERGFQFYVAGVRLPVAAALSVRHAERDMRSAFGDLDTAFGCLRGPDGMVSVIVTAQGRAAFAAAVWSAGRLSIDGHHGGDGLPARADALILSTPVWPARGSLHLNIACPVLVIDGRGDSDGGSSRGKLRTRSLRPGRVRPSRLRQGGLRPGRPRQGEPRQRRQGRPGASAMHLGSHVTWLALADADCDRQLVLTELGRWLGAYMYGLRRDQLL